MSTGRWGQSGYSVTGAAGGAVVLAAHVIQFTVGTATASSSTALPAGAVVCQVGVDVTTGYTAGATLEITCGAVVLLDAVAINAQVISLYVDLPFVATAGGVITATVTGGPVAGAATVSVLYAIPSS